jgi:type 1 fimbriae regulatory protein FimB
MSEPKRKHLTESELDLFLKAARQTRHKIRDYCMALIAFRHGMRVSELIDIRLDEIDLEGARLFVRRKKGSLSTHQPIEGDELRAIRAWLRERAVHGSAHAPWVFLSERGGKMCRQAVNYLFEQIGKKAGLSFKTHPHMLRHSCGYAMADRNITALTIKDYLGHKNIQHTVGYVATNAARFNGIWRK